MFFWKKKDTSYESELAKNMTCFEKVLFVIVTTFPLFVWLAFLWLAVIYWGSDAWSRFYQYLDKVLFVFLSIMIAFFLDKFHSSKIWENISRKWWIFLIWIISFYVFLFWWFWMSSTKQYNQEQLDSKRIWEIVKAVQDIKEQLKTQSWGLEENENRLDK